MPLRCFCINDISFVLDLEVSNRLRCPYALLPASSGIIPPGSCLCRYTPRQISLCKGLTGVVAHEALPPFRPHVRCLYIQSLTFFFISTGELCPVHQPVFLYYFIDPQARLIIE